MQPFQEFFHKYPALYYALFATVGAEAALQNSGWILLISILLALPYINHFRAFFGPSLALGFYILTSSTFVFTEIPKEGVLGHAWISIDQISYQTSGHTSSYIYRGKVLQYFGADIAIKGVPFFMKIPNRKSGRPEATSNYLIHCKILPGHGKRLIIKPTDRVKWEPIEAICFAEERFLAKMHVKKWIDSHFFSSEAAKFLSGLIVGEFDDAKLKTDFQRFGLLHLLAISGFHFSILASLIGLILRPILNPRPLSYALIAILTCYFCFLGFGPSILRAFMTILLFYGAILKQRSSLPMNSLGFALLASILLDPILLDHLGFQFSFLSTAAILMGFQPCLDFLNLFSPKRSLETVLKWPILSQIGYIFIGFFKNSLAITLATTWIALPLSLYYFQVFPVLSLVYNLFFPFFVSLSMTMMLLGFLFSPIPFLASPFFTCCDYFTSFILNMTYDIPVKWDILLTSPPLHPNIIVLLISSLFLITIYLHKSNNDISFRINI